MDKLSNRLIETIKHQLLRNHLSETNSSISLVTYPCTPCFPPHVEYAVYLGGFDSCCAEISRGGIVPGNLLLGSKRRFKRVEEIANDVWTYLRSRGMRIKVENPYGESH